MAVHLEQRVLELRKRGWGPARIAWALEIGHSSVHRILLRHGRNRLRPPTPRVFRRYGKSRPGELLHLDLKYLYRWPNSSREYAYAGVDDFTREAVAAVRPHRSSQDAVAFLKEVVTALPSRSRPDRQRSDLQYAPRLLRAAANAVSTMLPQLGNRTLADQPSSSENQGQGQTVLPHFG